MKLINNNNIFEDFDLKYITILLPFWLELIDFRNYSIMIPGFPYTLGMLSFIVFGIAQLTTPAFYNKAFMGLSVMWIGFVIGSFFGEKVKESIFRALGLLPILFAILGLSRCFFDQWFMRFLDALMVIAFCKWSLYIINLTISGGSISSYSESFNSVDRVLNHHTPGIYISISGAYILNRFFRAKNNYNLLGFVLFAFTLILCILLESRSNFIFIIINFLIGLIILGQNAIKVSAISGILVLGINLIFLTFFSEFDFIIQRFDATDADYLESTNHGRSMLYETFIPNFLKNPFGRGLLDVYIDVGLDVKLLMHNNYATFIIAGGIVAFFGILKLVWNYLKVGYKIYQGSKFNAIETHDLSIFFSVLIFLLTLTTIDLFGGIVSNLMFSMVVYLCQKYLPIRNT